MFHAIAASLLLAVGICLSSCALLQGEVATFEKHCEQKYLSGNDQSKERWAKYHLCLGRGYSQLGQDEKAAEHYRLSIDHEISADAYGLLGEILLANGKFGQAFPYLKTAIELDPVGLGGQYNLIRAYYLLGNKEAARKQSEAAMRDNPKELLLRFLVAEKLKRDGDIEESLFQLKTLATDYPGFFQAQWYAARAFHENGNIEEALYYGERAHGLNSRAFEANWILADCYLQKNEAGKAASVLSKLLESQELSPEERSQIQEKLGAITAPSSSK
ncbi:MAG: tetratricopeptide repeat protein [Bdellovibrionota bacterium]